MNSCDEDQVIRFRHEIEHEDERRRVMTQLAYHFANDWITALSKGIAGILVLQAMIVFGVVFSGGLPYGASSDPRFLLMFAPMAFLPILPMMIFKWCYARWALVVVAALGGVAWIAAECLQWIMGYFA